MLEMACVKRVQLANSVVLSAYARRVRQAALRLVRDNVGAMHARKVNTRSTALTMAPFVVALQQRQQHRHLHYHHLMREMPVT